MLALFFQSFCVCQPLWRSACEAFTAHLPSHLRASQPRQLQQWEKKEREREYEVRWNWTISSAHQFVFFPYLQYSPEPIKLYTQTHPHTQEIIYLSNFTLCISPEAQPLRYLDASTAASITEPTRPQIIGRYAILRPECATTDNICKIWMCVTPTRGGSRGTKVNSLTLSGLVWPQQMSGLSHRYWCCWDVSIFFLSL